jgi:hypothetical protein
MSNTVKATLISTGDYVGCKGMQLPVEVDVVVSDCGLLGNIPSDQLIELGGTAFYKFCDYSFKIGTEVVLTK